MNPTRLNSPRLDFQEKIDFLRGVEGCQDHPDPLFNRVFSSHRILEVLLFEACCYYTALAQCCCPDADLSRATLGLMLAPLAHDAIICASTIPASGCPSGHDVRGLPSSTPQGGRQRPAHFRSGVWVFSAQGCSSVERQTGQPGATSACAAVETQTSSTKHAAPNAAEGPTQTQRPLEQGKAGVYDRSERLHGPNRCPQPTGAASSSSEAPP